MAKQKPNLFQSIGGAVSGVGKAVGGVARGAREILNLPTGDLTRARVRQQEILVINNAAGLLSNTPADQQENILAAFKRIGLSEEAISAAQQVAKSGKPLTDEDVTERIKGFQKEGLGAQAAFRRGGTEFQVATPTGKRGAGRTTSKILSDLDKVNNQIIGLEDTEDKSSLPLLQETKRGLESELASVRGLEKREITTTTPAETRTVGFFEGAFTPKKRGETITTVPETTTTETTFAPKVTKKTLQKKADTKLKDIKKLTQLFRDKKINATEFKNLQIKLRNGSITIDDILKKLRKGK